MTNIIETVSLPLVPLRGVTVFPNMIMHLDIGRENSINALEAAMVADRRVFLIAQREADDDNPTQEDLYTIGTLAEIRQIINQLEAESACLTIRDLAVSGHDLMAAGFQGPAIGQTLSQLLELVLEEQLPNDKQALLAHLTEFTHH